MLKKRFNLSNYWNGFLGPVLMFVLLLIVGTFTYHFVEGWSYLDSLYFIVITATTVGYGDITPITVLGKLLTIIYAFFSIGLVFYFISLFGRHFFNKSLHHKLVSTGRIKHQSGVKKIKRKPSIKHKK